MSILKDIKMDVFLARHPKVLTFKREAKALKNELKDQAISLMQCQEIVAQRHGFNNWHHFAQLIKKSYQANLENIPYHITTTLEKNDHFLIGYDINLGHYKWQDDSSMRTHQLVIGEDIYQNYDVFLAKQAIEKKQEVLFLNGTNDIATVKALQQQSVLNNREKDVKIIGNNDHQKIYNDLSLSSGAIVEVIVACVDVKHHGEYTLGKTISLLSGLIMALTYQRDLNQSVLPLELIKQYLDFNQLLTLLNTDLPYHIIKSINSYLTILPDFLSVDNYTDITVAEHTKLTNIVYEIIDSLLDSNIFSNDTNAIHINTLLSRDKSIYILNIDNKLQQQFLLSLIKQSLFKQLGRSIEGSHENKTSKIPSLYNVFLRQTYVPRGMSVAAAQFRALGYSVTYSYSSFSKMQEILGNECFSLIANTNTRIIGSKEKDCLMHIYNYNTVDTIFNLNYNKYVNHENIQDNYVWVIKKDDISQVSFKNNK